MPNCPHLDLTGALNLPGNFSGPETFLLINNDGSDSINGTFDTLLMLVGYNANLNYAFTGTAFLGRVGDGNDFAVTISLASVPEPSRAMLLLMGLVALGMRRRGPSSPAQRR